MSRKRTKALSPSDAVRREVYERDRWCIFCGDPHSKTLAHFISRAQGGLGIKENLARVCIRCHHQLDHTTDRKKMLAQFRDYLESLYPHFTDEERVFKRWTDF